MLLGKHPDQLVKSSLDLIRDILRIPSEKNEHPDLFHLRPTGKARIIPVDKTRELISVLNRTSNQGGAKVALIHEADRMRKEAANAFLKTLEEPPPQTYLILLTTRPYSLLPTIRSRCLLQECLPFPHLRFQQTGIIGPPVTKHGSSRYLTVRSLKTIG